MNNRLLFVNPRIMIRKEVFDNPAFCVTGMLYAASAASSAGYDVKIIDAFTSDEKIVRKDDKIIIGEHPKKLLEKIRKEEPDIIFINYSDFHREINLMPKSLRFLLKQLDEHPAKVILANFHLSECMKYFNLNLDKMKSVAPGRYNLMDGYFQDKVKEFLKDNEKETSFLESGKIDFGLIDIPRYSSLFRSLTREGLIKEHESEQDIFPLFTSQGCNFNCFFCSERKGRWRPFPLEDVKNDIKYLSRRGISKIFFLDLLANMDNRRFNRILDTIIDEGLKAHFTNGLRIDLLDEESIKRLAQCTDILSVSIESADQEVLNGIIQKRLDLSTAEKNIKLISEHGIQCYAHYMIGSPGESKDSIEKTRKLAERWRDEYNITPRIQEYIPVSVSDSFDEYGNNILSRKFVMRGT